MPVSGGTGKQGRGRRRKMKKHKQNKYGSRCGLSQINGQVFKQKKKRYENVTLKAEILSGTQTQPSSGVKA